MNNIIAFIRNAVETATILPACQGAVEVHVQDVEEVAMVLKCIADAIYEYDTEDIQITLNQKKGIVYIDPIDREEDDDDEKC